MNLMFLPLSFKMYFFKNYVFFALLFFFAPFNLTKAQIIPANDSQIHYVNVHFQELLVNNAVSYKIEINTSNIFNDESASVISVVGQIPSFFISDLGWNQKYYWRVKAYNKTNECINVSETHHFKIQTISTDDFTEVNLKVNFAKPDRFSKDYISLDNTRSIFDRNGNKVWSMPMISGIVDHKSQVRDIKLTKESNITFLTDKNIYEIDFMGNVIWSGPQPCKIGKDTVKFHHAFTKDKEGYYWVLGNYKTYRKVLSKIDEKVLPFVDGILITDTGVYRKIEMDVLLKFNKDHKLLWYWNANAYLKDIDLNYTKNSDSVPEFSVHSNAFSINNSGTVAYVGMRDMSRIVKIDIKTKKVIASYGAKMPSGEAKMAVNEFKSQHDANVTDHNSILILNNNTRGAGPSSIIELKDNIKPGENHIVWKFNFDFDTLTNGKSIKGGNVVELNSGNLLICAGAMNRVFEVSKSKEVVWDAFILMKSRMDTLWHAMPQYRCNTINSIAFKGVLVRTEIIGKTQNMSVGVCYIINSGNVSDSYKLEIKNSKGKIISTVNTPLIGPGESFKATINVSRDNPDLMLKVQSTTNKYVLSRQPFMVK